MKNKIIAYFIKKFLNKHIKEYGKLINLIVDSKNKDINLEILLKGEKDNIAIKIEKYEIISKDNSSYLKFKDFKVSRQWLEILAENIIIPNYAPNRMIKVNSILAKVLRIVL